ncbi:MAG: gamma-glutamyltransferase [Beijerinckiaceae bacterium]
MPAPVSFVCEKTPAIGSRGMVVTNHPLASSAATEVLLAGGNAVDAAVAALFALTVVEPMMVGVLGGGLMHIRTANGEHTIIDAISTAPASAHETMFEPTSDGKVQGLPNARDAKGRRNAVGAAAVATPGALAGWSMALERFGTQPLARVMAPAIRFAEEGFTVTPYLADCITDIGPDLAQDEGMSALFLPGGKPAQSGHHLVQKDYASTLRQIAEEGPGALHGGTLGKAVASYLQANGGHVSLADLVTYKPLLRQPIHGRYRGYDVIGPPPPASSGVHIAQMLAILEGFDLKGMGFGSTDTCHLIAEAMRIAFADRAVATADPAFVKAPVDRLISTDYAAERRAQISMAQSRAWHAGVVADRESADTTHVTVADAFGNVVSATQTINGLFGACLQIPGTGMIANNYMHNFDPHPGRALSIAPGKRVFTSMAPMMLCRDGRVIAALGLPGGLRIFPSALQAIINLIDHGMTPQQAVEAPRIWTEGGALELEPGIASSVADALSARGHVIAPVRRIAGGMSAITFDDAGGMTGAACWRADGTPVGISGGLARAGVRFSLS